LPEKYFPDFLGGGHVPLPHYAPPVSYAITHTGIAPDDDVT